jgi:hypothetical protein
MRRKFLLLWYSCVILCALIGILESQTVYYPNTSAAPNVYTTNISEEEIPDLDLKNLTSEDRSTDLPTISTAFDLVVEQITTNQDSLLERGKKKSLICF